MLLIELTESEWYNIWVCVVFESSAEATSDALVWWKDLSIMNWRKEFSNIFCLTVTLYQAVYATACLQTGFHSVVPRVTSRVLNCQQPPGSTMPPTAIKLARVEQVICIPYPLSLFLPSAKNNWKLINF